MQKRRRVLHVSRLFPKFSAQCPAVATGDAQQLEGMPKLVQQMYARHGLPLTAPLVAPRINFSASVPGALHPVLHFLPWLTSVQSDPSDLLLKHCWQMSALRGRFRPVACC